ncbi:MAG: hypothetical protein ACR2RE_25790 [Geminicoccaceae bacterium]
MDRRHFDCVKLIGAFLLVTPILQSQVAAQQAPLDLDLEGEITARCEVLGFGSGSNAIDLASTSTQSFDFDISCNLPMQLELSSANGALVNEQLDQLASAGSDWSVRMPYDATITVDSIGLREATTSDAMANGVIYRSGGNIPFDTSGQLVVEPRVDGALYPAGTYRDVISITVFPEDGAGV